MNNSRISPETFSLKGEIQSLETELADIYITLLNYAVGYGDEGVTNSIVVDINKSVEDKFLTPEIGELILGNMLGDNSNE